MLSKSLNKDIEDDKRNRQRIDRVAMSLNTNGRYHGSWTVGGATLPVLGIVIGVQEFGEGGEGCVSCYKC